MKIEKKEIEKKEIKQILKEAKNINVDLIAEEILVWTILNVENFIDNTQKIFKLDIIIDSEDKGENCSMPETLKLQNLYRDIPEDENTNKKINSIIACRDTLNHIVDLVFKKMKSSKTLLDKLYEKMIYYYEMSGIYNGKPLVRQLQGGVDVIKFEYEAFQVGVKITAPDLSNVKDLHNEKEIESNKKIIKQYTIPEGFTLWIELAFTPVLKQVGIF